MQPGRRKIVCSNDADAGRTAHQHGVVPWCSSEGRMLLLSFSLSLVLRSHPAFHTPHRGNRGEGIRGETVNKGGKASRQNGSVNGEAKEAKACADCERARSELAPARRRPRARVHERAFQLAPPWPSTGPTPRTFTGHLTWLIVRGTARHHAKACEEDTYG
eukprot:358921-Chlamydomonas_euryale.AAC.2